MLMSDKEILALEIEREKLILERELRTAEIELDSRRVEIEESRHELAKSCLLYTSPSPRDRTRSRMPSSA